MGFVRKLGHDEEEKSQFCTHLVEARETSSNFSDVTSSPHRPHPIRLLLPLNSPELEPPSVSQCDIPNSDALSEFELPPQSELVRCSAVELPSDDKAVKPSMGVG